MNLTEKEKTRLEELKKKEVQKSLTEAEKVELKGLKDKLLKPN